MSKKHVQVTDMTFGQLYDAVASGEELYARERKLWITNHGELVTNSIEMTGVIDALGYGKITLLVEAPWTDQLDGTWENGVWCMVWDENNEPAFGKVTSFIHDLYGTYESAWTSADPLPTDLADQLEKLSQNACASE